MTGIKFYKATSKGGLDPIDNSTDSLHYRRSIVIEDDNSSTLWIIHGSGAAKTTQKSAEKNAGRIKDEKTAEYSIQHIDYDDAEDKIQEILSVKTSTKSKKTTKSSTSSKSSKLFPIPDVPGKSKKSKTRRREEKDEEGPIISEFQISYYVEESDGDVKQEVSSKISEFQNAVHSIVEGNPKKASAKKTLQSITDEIIDIIYKR